MTDLLVALGAGGMLAGGLAAAIALARLGAPKTYVRDLVHVGTGVWVLGWPLWRSPIGPIAITTVTALLVLTGPRALRDALTGDDERWGGIVVYVVTYAVFTALAFLDQELPAAGALLALSLGDGLGGLVGRRYGKHHFRVPGGKRKSYEGSITVAVAATLGILLASALFGGTSFVVILAAGLVAALAEALSPRSTDNAIVPLAVWLLLRALT